MDYYIIEFQNNYDIDSYYKELTKIFNDNIIYYNEYINTCSFFLCIFLISTITGICICNSLNPNQNYILIQEKDNKRLSTKILHENNV